MGDDNYDNEFYKERPQKNDEEGEDEREGKRNHILKRLF